MISARHALVLALFPAGCSVLLPAAAPAAGPLNARVTPDKKSVHRTIGPRGGRLVLTTRNRTRVTLVIPAGALATKVRVSLRLVRRLRGTPLQHVVAAVVVTPDGRLLAKPASLTFRPAHAIPIIRQVPFAARSRGKDLHLFPLTLDRRRIEMPLTHFSIYGIGDDRGVKARGARAGCIPDAGCLEVSSDEANEISDHIPADDGAKVEADLGEILKYAKDKGLSPTDPVLKEAMAHAFLPLFEAAAEPLQAYLRAPTAEGWETAIAPAVLLGRWLQLMGFSEGFALTPPPSDDPGLRAQLAALQQILSRGVPAALDAGYAEARRRCIVGHDLRMRPVLMHNGYVQLYVLNKDIYEQARADAARCGAKCPPPQRLAAVPANGVPRFLAEGEQAPRGTRQMCWPVAQYRAQLDGRYELVQASSPVNNGDSTTTGSTILTASATATWNLVKASVTGGTPMAEYRLVDPAFSWSISRHLTEVVPDNPSTSENESCTETWSADANGTTPVIVDASHLIMRFEAQAPYVLLLVDTAFAGADYVDHKESTCSGSSDSVAQFDWPTGRGTPFRLAQAARDNAYGMILSGTFSEEAPETITWRLVAVE